MALGDFVFDGCGLAVGIDGGLGGTFFPPDNLPPYDGPFSGNLVAMRGVPSSPSPPKKPPDHSTRYINATQDISSRYVHVRGERQARGSFYDVAARLGLWQEDARDRDHAKWRGEPAQNLAPPEGCRMWYEQERDRVFWEDTTYKPGMVQSLGAHRAENLLGNAAWARLLKGTPDDQMDYAKGLWRKGIADQKAAKAKEKSDNTRLAAEWEILRAEQKQRDRKKREVSESKIRELALYRAHHHPQRPKPSRFWHCVFLPVTLPWRAFCWTVKAPFRAIGWSVCKGLAAQEEKRCCPPRVFKEGSYEYTPEWLKHQSRSTLALCEKLFAPKPCRFWHCVFLPVALSWRAFVWSWMALGDFWCAHRPWNRVNRPMARAFEEALVKSKMEDSI